MAGNSEAYAAFKVKLESLPENIVVIASHTQTDSRKEKVSSGCFVTLFLDILALFPSNLLFLNERKYFLLLYVECSLILADCSSQNLEATKQHCSTLLFRYALLN